MRIIFMGTPDFAVPCLQALIDSGHEIAAVFTQPDKPKGRGYQMAPPPVKELALSYQIPVFQPQKLRNNEEAMQVLLQCKADLLVTAAYGKILPKEMLDLPKYGCINVHASLLPKYRGAGPIQWAIINGETETGVTTMYMAEGIDTGDMLEKDSITIGENETADELHDRLAELGAKVLLRTLEKMEAGTLSPQPQDDSQSTHAPMLDKEMALLDFTKPAQQIHNLIRGLSSWPCAYTYYHGKRLKIYRSRLSKNNLHGVPGTLLDSNTFTVACGDGAVELEQVQYEGGRKMSGQEFLRGRKPNDSEVLG
ncbi:MAG: methionyl-tRNA formyltransferase [Candidatus Merdivicinus sp.]|jgi:methionyl-tRNA formyltransferase